ncbi:MAG: HxlR family transcriptional regulator [Thaumarchaeota archaeon 13_1_40CM_4_38_7]|nr:MAG: HxlR family transcriptional regulator [Thaumarchaeota archaeon 13_1_40CM_4_38_7]OLC92237.1 MAG: HxlR family transcriptional regulator [Thaumarchaeota archaeon 13_1_40CM_3_38_6]
MKCCPIDNTFKIVGKKFTIHILRNMIFLNQTRFSQFLESIEGINPKTLSVRLHEMEKSKLVKRKVYPDTPLRIEYTITEKGEALKPIIEQMAAFSMKYCSCDVFRDGKPRTVEQVFGKLEKTAK